MPKKISSIEIPEGAAALDRNFEGNVYISDIDKTYLATQIDSLGGLLRAAFETGERKENVPGFSTILRALVRGPHDAPQKNPLFFVSASPPQMRKRLMAKMDFDGLSPNGLIFKNQFSHVRSGRFNKLREQIGFKLGALLTLWLHLPPKSKIYLFGDDSESDAVVFSLFTEVLAKNIEGQDLFQLLRFLGVFREEALRVSWVSRFSKVSVAPVRAAFINLETGSQAAYYSRFGTFLYPTENSLQTALVLYEKGLIRERAVVSVGRELVLKHDFNGQSLGRSLVRAEQRGLFRAETIDELWPKLFAEAILSEPPPRPPHQQVQYELLQSAENQALPKKVDLRELMRRYSEEGRY
jgi:hypothetical protein